SAATDCSKQTTLAQGGRQREKAAENSTLLGFGNGASHSGLQGESLPFTGRSRIPPANARAREGEEEEVEVAPGGDDDQGRGRGSHRCRGSLRRRRPGCRRWPLERQRRSTRSLRSSDRSGDAVARWSWCGSGEARVRCSRFPLGCCSMASSSVTELLLAKLESEVMARRKLQSSDSEKRTLL
ncbi:hypothetical protein BHE74_00031485, partial [Ensete ventricosum]